MVYRLKPAISSASLHTLPLTAAPLAGGAAIGHVADVRPGDGIPGDDTDGSRCVVSLRLQAEAAVLSAVDQALRLPPATA